MQGLAIERIHRLNSGTIKAFVDILINDMFIVKGLRVMAGAGGLFVSMPSTQGKDGKWYDTSYPATKEIREEIQDMILASFQDEGWDA